MLTKRTNVLLEEADHQLLLRLAQQRRTTIGELIRQAVKTTYKQIPQKTNQLEIQRRINRLKKAWTLLSSPKIPLNYRELVDYGRKY